MEANNEGANIEHTDHKNTYAMQHKTKRANKINETLDWQPKTEAGRGTHETEPHKTSEPRKQIVTA